MGIPLELKELASARPRGSGQPTGESSPSSRLCLPPFPPSPSVLVHLQRRQVCILVTTVFSPGPVCQGLPEYR